MKHVFHPRIRQGTEYAFSTGSGRVPVNREQTLPSVAVTERAGARFSFSTSLVDLRAEFEDGACVEWSSLSWTKRYSLPTEVDLFLKDPSSAVYLELRTKGIHFQRKSISFR